MHEFKSVPMLVVTGTVGVGKTSVAAEISDILSSQEEPHAFVDLDALACSWPPRGRFNTELALKNLAAVWENFRDAGARRLVISCAVESQDDVSRYREAVPGATTVICRLVASHSTKETRLRARETGAGLAWHLHRTAELESILQRAALEDFQVVNEIGR